MPTSAKVFAGEAWEDSGWVLYAYVQRDNAGTLALLQQADVSTITYKTFAGSSSDTADTSGTFDKTLVVYDTIQTGTAWVAALGSVGGNVRLPFPGTSIPTGKVDYTAEVTFTLTGGTSFPLVVQVRAKPLRGS